MGGANGSAPVGVVVMAYGTPSSPEAIEAYYTHIRRGRPPEPAQLAELQGRYEAIGGLSPLLAITRAQAEAIRAALGDGYVVELGLKHAAPFIEDAVATLAEARCSRLVGVVLAPHYSRGSVGEYASRLAAAAEGAGLATAMVERWHDLPEWRAFTAAAVRDALADMPHASKVLFTAHSLPERVLVDDPYPHELHASAYAIAAEAGLAEWSGWGLAWQSAGRTADPWRGPDVLAVLRDLADTGRTKGVVVCPQGFVADHLEVLYDLDVEAARVATEVGLAFARTASVNADPVVMGALAARVATAAGGAA